MGWNSVDWHSVSFPREIINSLNLHNYLTFRGKIIFTYVL